LLVPLIKKIAARVTPTILANAAILVRDQRRLGNYIDKSPVVYSKRFKGVISVLLLLHADKTIT